MEAGKKPSGTYENYLRQRWSIQLFEHDTQLLEAYEIFPKEIRLAVRDNDMDSAREALRVRYADSARLPHYNLDESVDNALSVIKQANDILIEMAEMHEAEEELVGQPQMTHEQNLLFNRCWRIACEIPIEIIECDANFLPPQ